MQAGVTPGVPNEQGQHANPYISGTAYPSVPLGNYDVPTGWPGPVARRQQGQVFGPPVSFLREAPQEAKAGVGFKSDHQREGNLFYFHTDHLGSTSYLTDTVGNVSQFVWYAPYGESLVDEHTTTYENPFKFSGKELDDITGLYDHGARNRNPITVVWYGIDELFEKYPENGPYSYCGGNPVKYFDPDGREFSVENVQYDPNIQNEYKGDDPFISSQFEVLDEINCTPSGHEMLKTLHESQYKFNIVKTNKDPYTRIVYNDKNELYGAVIYTSLSDFNTIAHEGFHFYQISQNQGGTSIFNEIEAYTFAGRLELEYLETECNLSLPMMDLQTEFGSSTNSMLGRPKNNQDIMYESACTKLLHGAFNEEAFNTALKLFKSTSYSNSSNLYNKPNYVERLSTNKEYLLKRFFK